MANYYLGCDVSKGYADFIVLDSSKQTVEPVFGVVKHAMGFRQFMLRGLAKVEGEWKLVTLAYNMKRLHNLKRATS